MLKVIANALGIQSRDERILMRLVLKEIERLREVEQGAKWYRHIIADPEARRRTIVEVYDSWSH